MNKLIAVAGFAATVSTLAALPSVAAAQGTAAESPHSFAGNMSLVSEYRFRGLAQTDFRPALQGGFDYSHASGAYLGVWASNVSWLGDAGAGSGSSLELDFYGGYRGTVGDFGYDVGLLQYYYPGSFSAWTGAGNPKPNTLEAYVAGSWQMLTVKYSHAVSDLFGAPDSKGSHYLEVNGNFDVGAGFGLAAHVGRQKVRNASDCTYTDWKLGLAKSFVGLDWGLAYVDTNAKDACYLNYRNKNLGKEALVLTVGKTF